MPHVFAISCLLDAQRSGARGKRDKGSQSSQVQLPIRRPLAFLLGQLPMAIPSRNIRRQLFSYDMVPLRSHNGVKSLDRQFSQG
jgi:hypothetical protein